jgi:hypothetical protein
MTPSSFGAIFEKKIKINFFFEIPAKRKRFKKNLADEIHLKFSRSTAYQICLSLSPPFLFSSCYLVEGVSIVTIRRDEITGF